MILLCSKKRSVRTPALLFALLAQLFAFSQNVHAKDLKILTSFLPIYIFTKNVVGDRVGVDVDCLLPGNVGPHDYHMRPSDMKRIAEADAVIINGLGIEYFIDRAVEGEGSEIDIFESSRGLPLIRDKDDEHRHGGDHGGGFNPHTWVSPKMAVLQVRNIMEFLVRIDPEGEGEYRRNAKEYIDKLEKVQSEMAGAAEGFSNTEIVTLHSAFDYLARDMGLDVVGVIYENPGEEPSAGDIVRLVESMKRDGIKALFSEPGGSGRMAEIVAGEAGAKVYVLDPVAMGRLESDYYEKVMRINIETLKEAFQR